MIKYTYLMSVDGTGVGTLGGNTGIGVPFLRNPPPEPRPNPAWWLLFRSCSLLGDASMLLSQPELACNMAPKVTGTPSVLPHLKALMYECCARCNWMDLEYFSALHPSVTSEACGSNLRCSKPTTRVYSLGQTNKETLKIISENFWKQWQWFP